MNDLTDAALRERAMKYECCDEWHYVHNPVERVKVDKLLASYIALRDAARAEQREEDAILLDDLARDMKEDGTREQRALMRGGIAAYKSSAAAIRAWGVK